jgi:glutamine amidotransferase
LILIAEYAGGVCRTSPTNRPNTSSTSVLRRARPGAPAPLLEELEFRRMFGREADPLFKYVKNGEYVYYVHSYYAKNCAASTLATSDYSIPVTGAVRQGLVYGTQFHPEKSGDTGLRLLKAFAEL